jgi:hypothetical protein
MDDLRHPDCRYCDEYERVIRGKAAEIADLKRRLRGEDPDELLDDQEARLIDRAIADLCSRNNLIAPAFVAAPDREDGK